MNSHYLVLGKKVGQTLPDGLSLKQSLVATALSYIKFHL